MRFGLSLAAFQAVSTVFHVLALSLAVFRLYRRLKSKNLWWDDYWAFFAFVVDLGYFTTVWIRQEVFGGAEADGVERQRRIILFWMTATLPALIVWSARISICLSIARLDVRHTAVRVRLWVYILTMAFGLMGGGMLFQKIYVCSRSTAWHYNSSIQCVIGKTVGYLSLAGDILADAVLTLVSFKFLWKVRMRRSRRRLLSWLFAANIWSSLAGIAYAVVVIRGDVFGSSRGLIIGVVVNLKATITLTVCNLLVVVTYIYTKFWSSSEDSDSESEDGPMTRRHSNLPSGRTTKQSPVPQSTVLILTDPNSDSTGISCNERARGITSTFMTWAGSELGWVARVPPPALTRPTHRGSASVPSALEDGSELPSLSRALSEPLPTSSSLAASSKASR